MNTEPVLITGFICFLVGAFVSLVPWPTSRPYSYFLSIAGASCFVISGLTLALGLSASSAGFMFSDVQHFMFKADVLSGYFLFVLGTLALAVSIYSMDYCSGNTKKGMMGFLYNLFVISIAAVFLSENIVTFLLAWESMSVISYFLVTFDRTESSARAGLLYAVMTHIGTAFILALFLVLYKYTGQSGFSSMKSFAFSMQPDIKNVVFLFGLIGFGTKAGLIPLHTWLPRAHPAAPSNISALMSGVMIKTGVYGFLRICADILGPGPEWWGIVVIITGSVSAILGILYALSEQDIKRLLAYSSIENAGIIFLGIGSAMVFRTYNMNYSAAAAIIAALYHVLNHAVFKGLLFMGAGSVMRSTGEKNIEHLGGLIKGMPDTAVFFLIGSLSICALPPLNGFMSEWLTYQTLLKGFTIPSVTAKILAPLGGAALAMTGALAAACFVKTFGITFLGLPRTGAAEDVSESPAFMLSGMALLAILCLLLGLFPETVMTVISPSANLLAGVVDASAHVEQGTEMIGFSGSYSPFGICATMIITFMSVFIFVRAVGGKSNPVHADSWDCGMTGLTPRMQYTGTAFTKPLRMIFKRVYLPRREVKIVYSVKHLFVKSISYSGSITPFFERYLYDNALKYAHYFAQKIRQIQSGSLHVYLGYILLTLILLLIFGI